ncbi:MAG: endonuclease III domain-containing protein [Candidatus Aenigmarchaeota archaeon]|nr:endonuclease III domain-containing protein [Candidatus Aenigmarchaeota archaeon]
MLDNIYKKLLDHFGPQGWWPTSNSCETPEWEVCVGAILTQNTNWSNVEKALNELKKNETLEPHKITKMKQEKLEQMIRSSGFYTQKADRLKRFARFVLDKGSVQDFLKNVTREELIAFNGIGRETADSMLLYACGRKYFVVDAYTKRIFNRLGLVKMDDYEEIRKFLEQNLPNNIKIYKEFHALIVKLGKTHCKKEPVCKTCPLTKICKKKI